MKNTINYLLGMALLLTAGMSHAYAKRDNYCNYQRENQRCVAVALADPKLDAVAKKFQPDATGKAIIYIVRSSPAVKRQASAINVDGHVLADLAPFTYVMKIVSPGAHKIRVAADKKDEIILNTEAGKLYFVRADLSLLFLTVRGHLQLVDEVEGKTLVDDALLADRPKH